MSTKSQTYGVLVLESKLQKWRAFRSWLSLEEAMFAAKQAFEEGLERNTYVQVRISKMEK
jgi:hypothetical protein